MGMADITFMSMIEWSPAHPVSGQSANVKLRINTSVDLARWQFATTSIYHFLFVPITIGTAFLVAVLQTRWHRSGDPDRLRVTRFFGNLLLINVAIGVVTGLVQDFQSTSP
jgi:cytochrome bd-type quinol oxidase subunit 1